MKEIQYKEINMSKKLLSEVLDIAEQIINKVYINYNKIIICFYAAPKGGIKEIEINIYELAHKCKEWAYTKNYHLNSKLQNDFWFCYCENLIHNCYDYVSEYKYTEPETIFEACEWILKQRRIYD